MAQTREGAIKAAAQKAGLTVEEYKRRTLAGLKRCTKCRIWKPTFEFNADKSRWDGLVAKCRRCADPRAITAKRNHARLKSPGIRERRFMREKGLAWCRGCRIWLPLEQVRHGACRSCINAEDRRRYATDESYKRKRKEHRDKYRRGVEAVPLEAEEILFEDFDGQCAYCGDGAETWDHIVPVSKGGRTTPDNIVPACRRCNSSKKAQDVFRWLDQEGLEPHPAFYDRLILHECWVY